MKYELTKSQEKKSKFGPPSKLSRKWMWQELDEKTKKPTGNYGSINAITEMEALDRLREAFETIGLIRWISKSEYYAHEVENEVNKTQKDNAK